MTGTRVDDILQSLQALPLLTPAQLAALPSLPRFADPQSLGDELVRRGWLTAYQTKLLAQGKGRELVLDQYVLLDLLGQGGMGSVYRARQIRMDRLVALKVIRKEVLDAPQARERFRREAAAAARLAHPNVVHVYDTNQVEGVPFLIMEYIEGTDLAQVLRVRGSLPVSTVCDWVRQAALGLQHAHEQGLVHRDIKPQNLMLTRQGTVKVMDLGLARTVGSADQATVSAGLTATGTVMGTPDYLAPEQAQDAKRVDIRADIYSLGCTLYHLLAGRVPFEGNSLAEKLVKHQLREPEPIEAVRPDVPAGLAEVVRHMMAKDPGRRYQTPAEVASALVPFAAAGVLPGTTPAAIPVAIPLASVVTNLTGLKRGVAPAALVDTVDTHHPLPPTITVGAVPGVFPRRRLILAVGLTAVVGILGLALLAWSLSGKPVPTGTGAGAAVKLPATRSTPPSTHSGPNLNPLLNKEYLTNAIGMKLVKLPAGVFQMGSPKHGIDERYRFDNEVLHEVAFPKPFWMGVFEVTQNEYTRIMTTNPSSFSSGGENSQSVVDLDTSHFPVENVSWHEADTFCKKLSALADEVKAGRSYRLPTEAEWEYACRAGAQTYTMYHFGNTINFELANFKCNEAFPADAPMKNPLGRPRVVGSYPANAFGLHDMHGNVWEWCADWFGAYDVTQRLEPTGVPTGTKRVVRGGSWNNTFVGNRAATRTSHDPAGHTSIYGFRVVCPLP